MKKQARFELYQDKKKEWRVKFIAKNGRIVGNLAEGYKRKAGAMKALKVITEILKPVDGDDVVIPPVSAETLDALVLESPEREHGNI